MSIPIQPVSVPLFDDGQGGLRVQGTRVLLERIIRAFDAGSTPEGIVQSYDTLRLSDVFAVLSWVLSHRAAANDYLKHRTAEADEQQRHIESLQPERTELRARLAAYKSRYEN